jgi:hypothetical protein
MSDRPIKVRRLTTSFARAVLRVEKTWPEPCVLLGSSPTSAIKVTAPGNVVVPLYDQMGPVSQRLAVTTLRRVAEGTNIVPDIFLVELCTPAGVQGYGMVAVPRAIEPRFLIERG